MLGLPSTEKKSLIHLDIYSAFKLDEPDILFTMPGVMCHLAIMLTLLFLTHLYLRYISYQMCLGQHIAMVIDAVMCTIILNKEVECSLMETFNLITNRFVGKNSRYAKSLQEQNRITVV